MRKIILLLTVFFFAATCFAQQIGVNIYPTHWWVGMKNPKLQLMLHGDKVSDAKSIGINYPGLRLDKVTKVDNKNYVFLDLTVLPSAKPGTAKIRVVRSNGIADYTFELKKRRTSENGRTRIMGVTSSDLMYLIMPDRFSNGDPANDRVPGMKDQTLNRDTIYDRHGGDLKGIQNHLEYLQDLGVTTVWLNPIIENDMPYRTEHGYAFTNHYKVDRRIGGEQAYRDLSEALHKKGMKLVQDAVYNHTGIEHFLFRDMPDSTWFHKWPKYTQTSYKEQPLFDSYASTIDKKIMADGWFTPQMPDVNQNNPLFATYLIQHAIWSTEEYGLDGWRIDTYSYNDLEFMNRCNKALLDEYPQIHLFGETWVHGVINQAFFTENKLNIPFKSNLPAVTDFQTHMYGILPALKEPFGWTEGVNKLYTTLAQDIVYKDPMKHVIFLDNHDKTRFFSEIGEDFNKYKVGIGWLLTSRGIPQLYYGIEILMKGVSNPDGWVRLDFPGGWQGDKENKFTSGGRSAQENEAFNFVRTIANYRKQSSALKTGKLMQYVPEEGVYPYFRYDNKSTVFVVMNTAKSEKKLKVDRLKERTGGFTKMRNIVNGSITPIEDFSMAAMSIGIFELMK